MNRTEMPSEVQVALDKLDTLTPDTLHRKSNASWGDCSSFHSLWFNHSPQAARYYLLPALMNGSLEVA